MNPLNEKLSYETSGDETGVVLLSREKFAQTNDYRGLHRIVELKNRPRSHQTVNNPLKHTKAYHVFGC